MLLVSRESDRKSPFSVVFEDDGRVAYAYLLQDRKIVADVWLYNVIAAPLEPQWTAVGNAPFLNPREYVSTEIIEPITNSDHVQVFWRWGDNDALTHADVLLRGLPFGRLAVGQKPGWARLAAKDGPLARRLE